MVAGLLRKSDYLVLAVPKFFFPCLQTIWGKGPMQNFGDGFSPFLSFFAIHQTWNIWFTVQGEKREMRKRAGVWLKWENRCEGWAQRGKGQDVGCHEGRAVVATHGQRLWWNTEGHIPRWDLMEEKGKPECSWPQAVVMPDTSLQRNKWVIAQHLFLHCGGGDTGQTEKGAGNWWGKHRLMQEKRERCAARLNEERGKITARERGKSHGSRKVKWNMSSLILQPFSYGGRTQRLQRTDGITDRCGWASSLQREL